MTEADPATGAVRAAAPTLRALTARGLARAHGRLGGCYLTRHGRALRERLTQTAGERPAASLPGSSGFVPRTGDGPEPDAPGAAARAQHAWRALLEIRRVTSVDSTEPLAVPAQWERRRPVHAVALALEAAGLPPSVVRADGRRVRSGYRVGHDADAPDAPDSLDTAAVRVEWRPATCDDANDRPEAGRRTGDTDAMDQLLACARELEARGWDTQRYLDARRRRYLLVTARGAA